ncbi:methyltransferase domain-containing protein [Geomesophilobacter sediminis]|uniref:Malonyl-[acyl-carrier protein] O-methyltransferase n=1 Tax=Geomesophilobacter sediminis TaxID=2798584 RepID=A0A8J7LVV1_9BACT|nr:methyltransferase domain-containing protein [Geomesophilobacter sediminis]MBJ6725969.1 methyltransferase domain-containing protein [Geomesophilobacter sediminis]
MVANIDRRKVQGAFHRQAADYDSKAVVQARVVERMTAILRKEVQAPKKILDIGAGTGNLLAELRRLYPEATAIGADLALGMCRAAAQKLEGSVQLVNADAERLPFADGVFDVVVSTSTYQWLPSLDNAFADVRRVLKPGGLFCFALFGERTLYELRESYRKVLNGAPDRTHSFHPGAEVLAALQRTGFSGAGVTSAMEVEMHPDVPELLRSLKRIGAGNAAPGGSQGLSQRRVMLEMMETYQREYGQDGQIPASYEVLYGLGRG